MVILTSPIKSIFGDARENLRFYLKFRRVDSAEDSNNSPGTVFFGSSLLPSRRKLRETADGVTRNDSPSGSSFIINMTGQNRGGAARRGSSGAAAEQACKKVPDGCK